MYDSLMYGLTTQTSIDLHVFIVGDLKLDYSCNKYSCEGSTTVSSCFGLIGPHQCSVALTSFRITIIKMFMTEGMHNGLN